MRFSTSTLMALVAAVATYASPVAKRQSSSIDDVTILNYACESNAVFSIARADLSQ